MDSLTGAAPAVAALTLSVATGVPVALRAGRRLGDVRDEGVAQGPPLHAGVGPRRPPRRRRGGRGAPAGWSAPNRAPSWASVSRRSSTSWLASRRSRSRPEGHLAQDAIKRSARRRTACSCAASGTARGCWARSRTGAAVSAARRDPAARHRQRPGARLGQGRRFDGIEGAIKALDAARIAKWIGGSCAAPPEGRPVVMANYLSIGCGKARC